MRLKQAAKNVLGTISRKRRERQLKASQEHVTSARIAADLRKLGIQPGDVLFVHSSLKSLGFVEGGADAAIDALYESIQPGGTLIIPTYYMRGTILATCQDASYEFDVRKHGSSLGVLPDTFVRRADVRRSVHPTHSVAAVGPKAEEIVADHHRAQSTFGEHSPWDRFTRLNGKLLGLGISLGPVTYYHHVEDMLGQAFPIDVWADETYSLGCITASGERIEVPVRPFRSGLMEHRIDHPSQAATRDLFVEHMRKRGLIHEGRVANANAWWMYAKDFYDELVAMAAQGITIYSSSDLASTPSAART